MFEFIKMFSVVICLEFVVVFSGLLIGNYVNNLSCDNYQEMTGRKTIYKYFDTCYVQQGSVMVPIREVQVREQEVKLK